MSHLLFLRYIMKFHWMVKDNLKPYALSALINQIDPVGYESMLLTFHSDEPDYIIRAANVASPFTKTKFMFAVRPYAMSSRYLAMMCKAFDDIRKNSVCINIVAGTFDQDAAKFDVFNAIEDRKLQAADFAQRLGEHFAEFVIKAPVYFSGSSDTTVNSANMYGDGIINLVSNIRDDSHIKVIARCWILIRDTDRAAAEAYDKLEGRMKENCIYGTNESVYNKLLKLPAQEFLVSPANTEDEIIHNFVKNVLTNLY